MKTQIKSRGFTIVELLIVIIVIAILATIVIIAYNGITTKANGSAAKENAGNVQKLAEAYNTDDTKGSGYPTLTQLNGYGSASTDLAKKPAGVTITGTALPTAANGKNTIGYAPLSNTGACYAYWDYTASPAAVAWLYSGNASTGGFSSGTVTCS